MELSRRTHNNNNNDNDSKYEECEQCKVVQWFALSPQGKEVNGFDPGPGTFRRSLRALPVTAGFSPGSSTLHKHACEVNWELTVTVGVLVSLCVPAMNW